MGGNESKEKVLPVATKTKTMMPVDLTAPVTERITVHPISRIVQNFVLVWIDANIDETKQIYQDTLIRFRSAINDVKIFTQIKPGIKYLQDLEIVKAFVITTPSLGTHLLPSIHSLAQIDAVYLFSWERIPSETWTGTYPKIKGIFNDIEPMCQALQEATKDCNQDSIAVSFVTVSDDMSNDDLNQLEPSFMYTQILKDAIFAMEYDDTAIKILVDYCREFYKNNVVQLTIIKEFEQSYRSKSPIWWYTRECFTYQMLNRALRTLEGATIVNMGFFIRDIHEQIKELYQSQLPNYHGKPLTVYRGQGLSTGDFEKLNRIVGGLMSFNNFLSTSTGKKVSLEFARRALQRTDTVGILFQMKIDPSISSAPFASIQQVSYYQTEEEILFSMHTIFRVKNITKMYPKTLLYQVDLELTADDDKELRILTDVLGEESTHKKGYERLALLMTSTAHYDKAEELFNLLLEQPNPLSEKARFYSHLSDLKRSQGDYVKALEYAEKTVQIHEDIYNAADPLLASAYGVLAGVYIVMKQYEKALPLHQDAIEILERRTRSYDSNLPVIYSDTALAYNMLGEHEKALFYYEKALELSEKNYPAYHPALGTLYNNISQVYSAIKDYEKAIELQQKSLEIAERSLPANHPSLGTSYFNIGAVYFLTKEYTTAISWMEKAMTVFENSFSANHPNLATVYERLGDAHLLLHQGDKALFFYTKVQKIYEEILPSNDPDLANLYKRIGHGYDEIDDHVKALVFQQKALKILEQILPANDPSLKKAYTDVVTLYPKVGDNESAIATVTKAIERLEETLPPNHPDLAKSYTDIAVLYHKIRNYEEAIKFLEKALEIRKEILSPDDVNLGEAYNNIGVVYDDMGESTKAIEYFNNAIEVWSKISSDDDSQMTLIYTKIADAYNKMKNYADAARYFEKILVIKQRIHHENDIELIEIYRQLFTVYANLKNYDDVIEYLNKAIKIYEANVPLEEKELGICYRNLGLIYYRTERSPEAIPYLEKSIELFEKTCADDYAFLASAYNNISMALFEAEQFEKSLPAFQRALDLWKKVPEGASELEGIEKYIAALKGLIAMRKLFSP